jgi:hypothetical protein
VVSDPVEFAEPALLIRTSRLYRPTMSALSSTKRRAASGYWAHVASRSVSRSRAYTNSGSSSAARTSSFLGPPGLGKTRNQPGDRGGAKWTSRLLRLLADLISSLRMPRRPDGCVPG